MLVGTRVPPNIQRSLDYHGIAWKEITFSVLRELLKRKGDEAFNHLFEDEIPIIKEKIVAKNNLSRQNNIEAKTGQF